VKYFIFGAITGAFFAGSYWKYKYDSLEFMYNKLQYALGGAVQDIRKLETIYNRLKSAYNDLVTKYNIVSLYAEVKE